MKFLAQRQSPTIIEPPFYSPPVWPAQVFLVARIGIPLFIVLLIVFNKRISLKLKCIISFILILVFALTFYLEFSLYGHIDVLRLFHKNDTDEYSFPAFV